MTNIFRAGFAVLALVFFVGCDQTADEYHQQKVADQLALLQAISGDYQGSITTQGASCGLILHLEAHQSATNSSDGTITTSQASLLGKITLNCGSWVATETAPGLQYFSKSYNQDGTFSGDFQVSISQGGQVLGTASLSIAGTIAGPQVTGTISMDKPAGFTGQYSAQKGGTVGQADKSQTSNSDTLLTYDGSFQEPCILGHVDPSGSKTCTVKVHMTVEPLRLEDGDFYNYFSAQRAVMVKLSSEETVVRVFDGKQFVVPWIYEAFPSANMDIRNGRLDGNPSTGILQQLSCNSVNINATTTGWSCEWTTSDGRSNSFVAAPSAKTAR